MPRRWIIHVHHTYYDFHWVQSTTNIEKTKKYIWDGQRKTPYGHLFTDRRSKVRFYVEEIPRGENPVEMVDTKVKKLIKKYGFGSIAGGRINDCRCTDNKIGHPRVIIWQIEGVFHENDPCAICGSEEHKAQECPHRHQFENWLKTR